MPLTPLRIGTNFPTTGAGEAPTIEIRTNSASTFQDFGQYTPQSTSYRRHILFDDSPSLRYDITHEVSSAFGYLLKSADD